MRNKNGWFNDIAQSIGALFILVSPVFPETAYAASSVTLSSTVFVERQVPASNGRTRIVLEEPTVVSAGDKLVFILNYRNVGEAPAGGLTVINPLPAAVAYQAAGGDRVEVSIDGGRNWGALAALKVRELDSRLRSARPDDVTHIRWALRQSIPVGAQGRLSFRGVVR